MAFRNVRPNEPSVPTPYFMDERDAAGFILVGYLTSSYSLTSTPGQTARNEVSAGNAVTTIPFATLPELRPFPELLQLAQELLLPIDVNRIGDTGSNLRRMREFLNLAEIASGQRPLIYGYLRPPLSELEPTGNWLLLDAPSRDQYLKTRIRIADALLAIGESPLGTDRWGRRFHQILPPTASQWRIVILQFNYPLCNLAYLANVGDNGIDDDDDLLQEDPIITMVDSLLEETIDSLILTETELYHALNPQATCHDTYYLDTILQYLLQNYQQETESNQELGLEPISTINDTQLQIIAAVLDRLRNIQ